MLKFNAKQVLIVMDKTDLNTSYVKVQCVMQNRLTCPY